MDSSGGSKEEGVPKGRKRKKGTFGPGNPPPGGSKKGRHIRMPSRLLKDMRLVYSQEKEKDLARHAPLRQMLENETEKFVGQLGQLERAHRSGLAKSVEKMAERQMLREREREGGKGVDQGSERAEELIAKLLQEWAEEKGAVVGKQSD